jgi:hypothetical protein
MNKYTATEEAYKHGYEKGYAAGKRDATDNNVGRKTNADRIRAMSDDELARELSLIAGWDRGQYRKAKLIGLEKVMLDYLQQPVPEDK